MNIKSRCSDIPNGVKYIDKELNDKNINSKERVKIITEIANGNRKEFMENQVGNVVSVLVEENNIGRTPDDIDIKIVGKKIPNKTICDVKITGIDNDKFIGTQTE